MCTHTYINAHLLYLQCSANHEEEQSKCLLQVSVLNDVSTQKLGAHLM